MAEWVNVKNKQLGNATALVTRDALELVYADKGWEEVAPAEAAKLHRERAVEINKARKEQDAKDQASMAAELAASGVDPADAGLEAKQSKPKSS